MTLLHSHGATVAEPVEALLAIALTRSPSSPNRSAVSGGQRNSLYILEVVALVKKIPWEIRQTALHELIQGHSAEHVAARAGLGQTTIKRWARMSGMELLRGAHGRVAVMAMGSEPAANQARAYRRLSLEDRSCLHAARAMPEPLSMRRIAAELGVAPSTISREIRAHQLRVWDKHHYDARIAHYRALSARGRRQPGSLETRPFLRGQVMAGLNRRVSPVQIAARLKHEFPGIEEMQVSHETIYQALYLQGKTALRHELSVVKALRSGRTTRKPASKLPRRMNRPWLDGPESPNARRRLMIGRCPGTGKATWSWARAIPGS